MKIPIFNNYGVMDFSSIKWQSLIYEDTPLFNFLDYEKSAISGPVFLDKMRFCELENIIHMWKNEKSLTKREIVEEIYNLFIKCFNFISFSYDFSKFYLFKVKLKAYRKGVIKKNKFFNFEIEVKNYDDFITNEIQSLGVLNHTNKKHEIRIGHIICLYFTDLYV
jgi:hypothetical protein